MHNQPSRTVPVVCGFVAYLILWNVITFSALYSFHILQSTSSSLGQTLDTTAFANESLDHIYAAQCAVLQFRITNDPQFIKRVNDHMEGTNQCLDRFHVHTTIEANRRLANEQMDLCHAFHEVFRKETEISEEPPDVQQQIRQSTDDFVEKAIAIGNQILMNQQKVLYEMVEEQFVIAENAKMILYSTAAVALVFGIIVCIVVVRLVNREPTSLYTDTGNFSDLGSAPVPTGDMRVVADRLQEVVNLLRK